MTAAPSPALLAAYKRSLYCVLLNSEEIVLRINHVEVEADRRLSEVCGIDQAWSIVTPCNPRSQRFSKTANQRRLRNLSADLSGMKLKWIPALNRDPTGEWPDEAGVLLCDPPPGSAEGLGLRYQQNAIVCGRLWAPPQLLWLTRPDGDYEEVVG